MFVVTGMARQSGTITDFIAIYGSIDTDELIKIAAGITRK